jgi:hypothetical protein
MSKILVALDKKTHKTIVESFGDNVDKALEYEQVNPNVILCWIDTPTFEKANSAFILSRLQGKNLPLVGVEDDSP